MISLAEYAIFLSATYLCLKEVNSNIIKRLRVNERIIAKEVRLVGEKGEQLGIMSLQQAKETAQRRNLDLVEVSPTAVPPVCRLLDYGKYRYEQDKKEREFRRSQKLSLLREVRLRPKIDNHDFLAKARSVNKLLSGGDKVKVTIMFRGREITHPENGLRLLREVAELLKGEATVDSQPAMVGKRMSIVFSPPSVQKAKEKKGVEGD